MRIVAIGEALWDLLPTGVQLGGTLANIAYHVQALGAETTLVSRVGNDPRGHDLLTTLVGLGLRTSSVQVDTALPTGTVTVELTDGQPTYTVHADVAWDAIVADAHGQRACGAADAVCFGTLAQRDPRSREAILTLVSATPSHALRVFDINLRQQYYSRELIDGSLRIANVLKLNDDELRELRALLHLQGDDRSCIDQLMDRFQLRVVALTRGARGSLLRTQQAWSEHSGVPATVVDTVGAGDAFTAAMTIGLLLGRPLDQINDDANTLAAFVASSAGGTPDVPSTIVDRFH
jgi:fructokinase